MSTIYGCRCPDGLRKEVTRNTSGFEPQTGCRTCDSWDAPPIYRSLDPYPVSEKDPEEDLPTFVAPVAEMKSVWAETSKNFILVDEEETPEPEYSGLTKVRIHLGLGLMTFFFDLRDCVNLVCEKAIDFILEAFCE